MQLPYEAIQGQNELHFTYLDTFGRPVIVYHKNNLVEQHIQEFEVRYLFMLSFLRSANLKLILIMPENSLNVSLL